MPAHRRLRQLKCAAQLSDRELMAVEEEQDATPRRVSENAEAIEDGVSRGGSHIYPYIRIKGRLLRPYCQGK